MDGYEENGSGHFGILPIIIFIGLTVWIAKDFYDDYRFGKKKPFWQGTELVQVCKTPYYSSDECKRLLVTLTDNNKTAQIELENGDYITTHNITCYFAAKSLPDEPKYVFCRSWDKNNQQWDFMPAWAHWPTSEELMKLFDKYK